MAQNIVHRLLDDAENTQFLVGIEQEIDRGVGVVSHRQFAGKVNVLYQVVDRIDKAEVVDTRIHQGAGEMADLLDDGIDILQAFPDQFFFSFAVDKGQVEIKF